MGENKIIRKIGLAKLFLWMEAERLESYPEAFARLNENRTYTKISLVRDTFGLIPSESSPGKSVREDFLNNIFGLENTSDEKVSIRGINALREIQPGVYQATQEALNIGSAYQKKDQNIWIKSLAGLIAKFEVRTRLMLYLLGKGGYVLSFINDEFFGFGSSRAEVISSNKKIALFADDARGFNELLQLYRWNALGPWWAEEIHSTGVDIAEDFVFEGLREPKPPTNKLNSRLKNSLFLMKYLGVIECQADSWLVNPIQATTIFGEKIAQDFVMVEFDHSPIERLIEWQEALRDEVGFVVVSNLAQRWAEYKALPIQQAETEFDAWMREQTYHGRVNILETNAGQPRLGRGLYGDDNLRKIRIEIVD